MAAPKTCYSRASGPERSETPEQLSAVTPPQLKVSRYSGKDEVMPDKKATTICIYHGNCADGFDAAWVVRKALGADIEFHAATYGQPVPDVTGKNVVIVDFS